MHIRNIIVILSVLLPGCGPKVVGYLGITDSDASDTSPGPNSDGTSEAGDTSDPSTSIGATTASTSTTSTTTTGGEGTSTTGGVDSGGPVVPPECLAVDHETCYDAALAACVGAGNWLVTPACIDAVQSCYPIGTQTLAAADVIGFCSAEVEEACGSKNAPGCSETFCTCTAGAFPYDWNNCWHLLLVACLHPAVASDCEAVLAGCYPAVTVGEYQECRQQVIEGDSQCNCPGCGEPEPCEDALDACLGA
jgi:hypothetical protein